MTRDRDLPANPDAAGALLDELGDAAWAAAAFVRLAGTGALSEAAFEPSSPEDRGAAATLAAAGLLDREGDVFTPAPGLAALADAGMLDARAQGMASSLGQLAGALGGDDNGWGAQDDATLLAQGRSSAMGGTMLAFVAVPSFEGLSARFDAGGELLDVGVGVGEITAAFCEALPAARVTGLDVLPRALELAHETIQARGLAGRVELRLQPVQELDDVDRFDLAWLPAPFIPDAVFPDAVERIRAALRPGGWLVVGAGRFDGDELSVAVTAWKTMRAGGTPLPADDARRVLEDAGLTDFQALPTPPGAPAIYAARRD